MCVYVRVCVCVCVCVCVRKDNYSVSQELTYNSFA